MCKNLKRLIFWNGGSIIFHFYIKLFKIPTFLLKYVSLFIVLHHFKENLLFFYLILEEKEKKN